MVEAVQRVHGHNLHGPARVAILCKDTGQTREGNTLRMAEIVNQLRAAGHAITDQDLARVSPLMHGHVIPNGTYRFADGDEPRIYAAAS